MAMNLSQPQETVEDGGPWHAMESQRVGYNLVTEQQQPQSSETGHWI